MDEHPVILFDGVCNLCNKSVQYVIKHDEAQQFRFASLQSDAGRKLLQQYDLPTATFNSFVLISGSKAYTRSGAALRVARQLKGFTSLLYGFIIVPKFIRDGVYKIIANNRYKWFGERKECMIPTPALQSRFLK